MYRDTVGADTGHVLLVNINPIRVRVLVFRLLPDIINHIRVKVHNLPVLRDISPQAMAGAVVGLRLPEVMYRDMLGADTGDALQVNTLQIMLGRVVLHAERVHTQQAAQVLVLPQNPDIMYRVKVGADNGLVLKTRILQTTVGRDVLIVHQINIPLQVHRVVQIVPLGMVNV